MTVFKYIDLRTQGVSSRKAAALCSISRTTGEKYYRKYKEKREFLEADPTHENSRTFIEECIDPPSYDSSSRQPRKYSPEVDALLDQILEDEEEKTRLLGSGHKQQLTCLQIWDLIRAAGFDIGLSTITKRVKEKRNRHRECFISQDYEPGDRFEYDFGEVKLMINGQRKTFYLAVMTSPWSGYRAAYLYENQKSQVFFESMIRFFNEVGGIFREGVYDNMRNVVSKFIGRNDCSSFRFVSLFSSSRRSLSHILASSRLSNLYFKAKLLFRTTSTERSTDPFSFPENAFVTFTLNP